MQRDQELEDHLAAMKLEKAERAKLFGESKRKARESREQDEAEFRLTTLKFLHEYLSLINQDPERRREVKVPADLVFETSRQTGWVLASRTTGVKAKIVLSIIPQFDEDMPLKPSGVQ